MVIAEGGPMVAATFAEDEPGILFLFELGILVTTAFAVLILFDRKIWRTTVWAKAHLSPPGFYLKQTEFLSIQVEV